MVGKGESIEKKALKFFLLMLKLAVCPFSINMLAGIAMMLALSSQVRAGDEVAEVAEVPAGLCALSDGSAGRASLLDECADLHLLPRGQPPEILNFRGSSSLIVGQESFIRSRLFTSTSLPRYAARCTPRTTATPTTTRRTTTTPTTTRRTWRSGSPSSPIPTKSVAFIQAALVQILANAPAQVNVAHQGEQEKRLTRNGILQTSTARSRPSLAAWTASAAPLPTAAARRRSRPSWRPSECRATGSWPLGPAHRCKHWSLQI